MSRKLHHECTRVPITALADCGRLLVVAEGPYLRFYERQDNRYLWSERVFEAQAIHGISELELEIDNAHLIVWGGLLVRTVKFGFRNFDDDAHVYLDNFQVSNVGRAPDWILDILPAPYSFGDPNPVRCPAVTAHNALLEIILHPPTEIKDTNKVPFISVSELTSGSRSILYSAHLSWNTEDHVIRVAAGTAFGEIIYWSWDSTRDHESRSRIHRVFLGHEGSIFGVHISPKLPVDDQESRRLLASCSDDRTIRIWDVSGVSAEEGEPLLDGDLELQRTRHTGFSNASFDTAVSNIDCVAIGWGHTSRVWKARFFQDDSSPGDVFLLSSGEDATSRTWRLVTKVSDKSSPPGTPKWQLELVDTAAYHNGKNVWSMALPSLRSDESATLGGADSKITRFGLKTYENSHPIKQSQYDIGFFASSPALLEDSTAVTEKTGHRSSKQTEFLRSYAFLDETTFILTTNSGRVYLETLSSVFSAKIERSILLAQVDDLGGYSVSVGESSLGVAFVASATGTLYAYTKATSRLSELYTVSGKIGEVFTEHPVEMPQSKRIVLLITLVGQKVAYLLEVNLSRSDEPTVLRTTVVPISDQITGIAITSMVHAYTVDGRYVFIGFRRGSIAVYRIPDERDGETAPGSAKLLRIIDSVHGKETVTAMTWIVSGSTTSSGHLVSIGRNGCMAIHFIDLANDLYHSIVHDISLPVGPNIEGLYIRDGQLHVYGFSNKEFVLYNTATEEVIMSVETGGAHRSWAFQPNFFSHRGGTLVWTRASSMHIHTQPGQNHDVIRSGGHGREIKAVAVSPVIAANKGNRQFIATGAEDTDIKIFQYSDNHLTCLRTLRKHTTGVQALQWSADGSYLFSSGGCEEFYVWRISRLPSEVGGIGVVCETSCPTESEHSDLRIMSFEAKRHSYTGFIFSMVFSNSTVKLYAYDTAEPEKWLKVASGHYFTSCLTQCAFLPSGNNMPHVILTAGTDGHAALWPFDPSQDRDSLPYHSVITLHQSSSKTLVIHHLSKAHAKTVMTLIVSGGDDGTLALLLACTSWNGVEWAGPPVIVVRAHASAVTACAVLTHNARTFVVTSGNDQWVRLWELIMYETDADLLEGNNRPAMKHIGEIKRVGKIKTSVADVSSMAVLDSSEEKEMEDEEKEVEEEKEKEKEKEKEAARVLICGVGMEVIRIEWETM
ncbi:WD repeat-containing protein 6 [Didymosphaeria variabile]|uniref:WD repeat-containing protein 6 n=1 Tax=Didymosphaeria variabile TaxID=1932322 RepID=A0A9W8XT26_9PLEO|nr:WD repeat-containing protein 6 [Didymosphaeria variabile]KAJ4358600.1 WD repeat-containing protein 6 [Didymosphaeria variabile]